jgi:hypothetical protein
VKISGGETIDLHLWYDHIHGNPQWFCYELQMPSIKQRNIWRKKQGFKNNCEARKLRWN